MGCCENLMFIGSESIRDWAFTIFAFDHRVCLKDT